MSIIQLEVLPHNFIIWKLDELEIDWKIEIDRPKKLGSAPASAWNHSYARISKITQISTAFSFRQNLKEIFQSGSQNPSKWCASQLKENQGYKLNTVQNYSSESLSIIVKRTNSQGLKIENWSVQHYVGYVHCLLVRKRADSEHFQQQLLNWPPSWKRALQLKVKLAVLLIMIKF